VYQGEFSKITNPLCYQRSTYLTVYVHS